MKTIIRRLRQLEDQFSPPVETAFSRHLLERLDTARRRLSDWTHDVDEREREHVSGLNVEQILIVGGGTITVARIARQGGPMRRKPSLMKSLFFLYDFFTLRRIG